MSEGAGGSPRGAGGVFWRLRFLALIPVLAFLTSTGARFREGGFTASWGAGLMGLQGSEYTGRIARNLDRYGFIRSRFGAPREVLPGNPPLILHYLNHPVAYWLMGGLVFRHLGRSVLSLKLMAAFFSLLFGLALTALLWRDSPRAGAVAGALALTLPLGSYYGFMTSTVFPCMAMDLLALWLARAWRERGGIWRGCGLGLLLSLACQCDWWGYFIFPPLLAELLIFGKRRDWRTARNLSLLALGNLAFTFLHVAIVKGSPEGALSWFIRLFASGSRDAAGLWSDPASWHFAQLHHLTALMTPSALLLAFLGILSGLFRGRGRLLFLLALFGLPNLYLSAAHARGHDFWVAFLLPLLAAGLGLFFEPWLGHKRPLVFWGALLLLLAQGGLGLRRAAAMEQASHDRQPQMTAKFLGSLGREGDILLVPMPLHSVAFYSLPTPVGGVATIRALKTILQLMKGRRLAGRVLYLHIQGMTPPRLLRLLRSRYPRERLKQITLFHLL